MLGEGDFNLAFLDLIKQVDGLKWSGNCNELNAAYAADGICNPPPLGRNTSGRWADILGSLCACYEQSWMYCHDLWV
jgi:hypothetical protein